MVNITIEIAVTLVPVAKYTLIDLYSILKAAFIYGFFGSVYSLCRMFFLPSIRPSAFLNK